MGMSKIGVDVKLMEESGFTPNELFYLLKLKDNNSSILGNMSNLKYLCDKGMLTDDGMITDEGVRLVNAIFLSVEGKFMPTGATSSLEELCRQYRELFPIGVKSAGHPVRGNMVNIMRKMRRFREEFPQFSDDVILQATRRYVTEKQREGYAYMKVAEYLIYKDTSSLLASLCDSMIENGQTAGEETRWGRSV
jgi:hypothetical protein